MSAPAFDAQALSTQDIQEGLSRFSADQLRALLQRANHEYWDEDAPKLPDPVYDQLRERLSQLAPEDPLLQEMGPSPHPAAAAAKEPKELAKIPAQDRFGAPVRHLRPMLSLEKCYETQELIDWAQKRSESFLVMPKIDGVAASLWFDAKGKLQVAASRGSGQIGEDMTMRVREVSQIPASLSPAPGHPVEVRGEIYMTRSVFDARYSEEFSHPRNLTAGSLKRKEPGQGARGEDLSFYAYDIDLPELGDESQKIAALRDYGFACPGAQVLAHDALAQSVQEHTDHRESLDFEVDGIVYRIADCELYKSLGATGHHPRGAIAYKFQGQRASTTLLGIEWSVSRTGAITPVALFEEVTLDGARLTRASLHNLGRFEALKLGKGATLSVTRRGGVIPMVEKALTHGDLSHPYPVPEHCPACQAKTERKTKRDGEFLFCSEPKACVLAQLGELEHFAKVTDMMGFGPKLLALAHGAKLLQDPADFFTLTLDALTGLERVGEKTANNLLAQVRSATRLELPVFLRSLGISHLGKHNAARLSQEFDSLDALTSATQERLIEIDGIQEIMATAILSGLEQRRPLIDKLLTHIEIIAPDKTVPAQAAEDSPIKDQSVLFTGTLTSMPRAEAQDCVKKAGGKVASGVSAKLDILVIGSGKGGPSSKEKKARALVEKGESLKILSEQEFWALMPSSLRPDSDVTP